MKNYKELIIRYLKCHRKRTLLTIIGIILSTTLLCSAGIMGESLQNTMLENVKENYGNFHVAFSELNENQVNMLENNIKIEEVGYKIDAALDQLSKNQTLVVTGSNKTVFEMLYYTLDKGKMPEKNNEIALEGWVLDNMKPRPHIGDKIQLDLSFLGGSKGEIKENLSSKAVKKQFWLTGILKNKDSSQYAGASTAIVTLNTAKELLNNQNIKYSAFVRIKKEYSIQNSIKEIQSSIGAKDDQVHQNSAVLSTLQQNRYNSINMAVFMIEFMAIAIIIIATIAVIYNAFNISVLERIHQFGVLRSIGTTPVQIRTIVFGEALLLSIIGIPLGLLCGIAAVKGVIGLFAMKSMAFFGGMKVSVSANILLGTSFLALATVLLSALGPAYTAGRVSPMEAILNTTKPNRGKYKSRRHPILHRIIGIEAVMAIENLKRNRKRFFFTVFSISLAVTLSIFFTCFMDILNRGTNSDANFHRDFAIDRPFTQDDSGFTLKDYEDITNIPGVKNVYRLMQKNVSASINGNELSSNYKTYLKKNRVSSSSSYSIDSHLFGYRDNELKLCESHLIKGSIDSKLMDKENGVIISQEIKINGVKMDASSYRVGDEIELLLPHPVKVKIIGILDRTPLLYNAELDKYTVITTEKVFKKLTDINTFARFDIELSRSADLSLVKSKLQNISERITQGRILDFNSNMSNTFQTEIAIILYAIVAVISIIGILNIINTISTNIILRMREFGILRAVGMTLEQMKKMIRIEGILYGIIGTFYGGIAGYVLSRILYNYFSKLRDIPWHFPWIALLTAGIIASLIGILSSSISLKRISKMEVVDAIRGEE